jgi:hypothetical protein
MVFVLVLGGGLGWYHHRARVQFDAVATIRRSGGQFAYSWERFNWERPNGAPIRRRPKPPWPDWLYGILGTDFLDTVTFVSLTGPQCNDESLCAACRLPWLEELSVTTGGEGARMLPNLPARDLGLTPGIKGQTLAHIGALRELRFLTLSFKLFPDAVNDQDMAFLKRLNRLERLELHSANLDGAWLVYLERLTNLKSLQLTETSMTAEGLGHLDRLKSLTATLNVHGTEFPIKTPNMTAAELAERGQMLRRIRLIRGK